MQLYRFPNDVLDDYLDMRILAIDTATNACSAALLKDEIVFERSEIAPRQHTQLLLPMIEAVLTESETNTRELDGIAFVAGPGSFTGIRIATSMAQGLSLGLNIPVLALSSLLVLAYGARRQFEHTEIFPCIDARREQIYWAHYSFSDNDPASEPQVLVEDCLTKSTEMLSAMPADGLVYGSGVDSHIDADSISYPQARDALQIATLRFKRGLAAPPGDAQAVYFRRGL